jgi:acetolactate synthase-1/2/3 large subunit
MGDYRETACQRPIMLLGEGARKSADRLIKMARKSHIPIMTTWRAIDLIDWNDLYFAGRPGIVASRGANKLIQECDVLFCMGASMDVQTVAYDYANFAPNALKIILNIDPAVLAKFEELGWDTTRMDAENWTIENISVNPTFDWVFHCEQEKLMGGAESDTITYQVCEYLSGRKELILVISPSCMAMPIFGAFFKQKKGQRIIVPSSGQGSMGASIPTAIGVAKASGKTVTVVDGEGSFMQNIQELQVVNRDNLPIEFIVFKNGGYASIRNSEMRAFGRLSGNMTFPDVKAVAKSFGVDVRVIECPCDEQLLPRVMFDGQGSLENMFPYRKDAK